MMYFSNVSRRKIGPNADYKGVLEQHQYESQKNSYILVFDRNVLTAMEVHYTIDPRDWDLIEEPLGKIKSRNITLSILAVEISYILLKYIFFLSQIKYGQVKFHLESICKVNIIFPNEYSPKSTN